MAVAVFFSMVPEMRPGPVAFEQPMEARYLKMQNSVIKMRPGPVAFEQPMEARYLKMSDSVIKNEAWASCLGTANGS